MSVTDKTQKTLNLLLSGKHPRSEKYEGKHVLVIEDSVFPIDEGEDGVNKIKELEKKYGKTPTLVFVPRNDITYILFVCKK